MFDACNLLSHYLVETEVGKEHANMLGVNSLESRLAYVGVHCTFVSIFCIFKFLSL